MAEYTAPGAMPRPNERRAIDDPGAGALAGLDKHRAYERSGLRSELVC
jgi:hypothetical protein